MKFFKPKFWDKNQISFFSVFLFPISLLIKILSLLKRLLTKTHECSIPIICVGNIYLGGTGKTPLCIAIYSILKDLNMKPVFIRKYYDAVKDEINLQKEIGEVYQNKKRFEAIKDAEKNKADVAILDDGLQDFSIYKNLSIVCFSEKQWIGNGLTIPSGPLRESLSSLKRANIVFINGKKNNHIENEILKYNQEIKIFYSQYKPININLLKNKKFVVFAGIGNPENFFTLLEENSINIIEKIQFPDHYKFSKSEIENLIEKAKKNGAELLTTEKDYFRIDNDYKKELIYLKIITVINNREEFIKEIKKII
jgi:tetraacyldisaccharide 4'-kinase